MTQIRATKIALTALLFAALSIATHAQSQAADEKIVPRKFLAEISITDIQSNQVLSTIDIGGIEGDQPSSTNITTHSNQPAILVSSTDANGETIQRNLRTRTFTEGVSLTLHPKPNPLLDPKYFLETKITTTPSVDISGLLENEFAVLSAQILSVDPMQASGDQVQIPRLFEHNFCMPLREGLNEKTAGRYKTSVKFSFEPLLSTQQASK